MLVLKATSKQRVKITISVCPRTFRSNARRYLFTEACSQEKAFLFSPTISRREGTHLIPIHNVRCFLAFGFLLYYHLSPKVYSLSPGGTQQPRIHKDQRPDQTRYLEGADDPQGRSGSRRLRFCVSSSR